MKSKLAAFQLHQPVVKQKAVEKKKFELLNHAARAICRSTRTLRGIPNHGQYNFQMRFIYIQSEWMRFNYEQIKRHVMRLSSSLSSPIRINSTVAYSLWLLPFAIPSLAFLMGWFNWIAFGKHSGWVSDRIHRLKMKCIPSICLEHDLRTDFERQKPLYMLGFVDSLFGSQWLCFDAA